MPGMEEFPRKTDVQCYNWGRSRKVELVTLVGNNHDEFCVRHANTVHVNLSLSEAPQKLSQHKVQVAMINK